MQNAAKILPDESCADDAGRSIFFIVANARSELRNANTAEPIWVNRAVYTIKRFFIGIRDDNNSEGFSIGFLSCIFMFSITTTFSLLRYYFLLNNLK